MTHPRTAAIVVAVLFIIATAASIVAAVMTGPILEDADYLAAVAQKAGTMTVAVLFMFLAAAAIAGIPVVLYPILRRHSETAALSFLVARLFEAMLYLMGGVFMLTLVVLARQYVAAPAPDAEGFATLGAVIRGAQDIAFITGTEIVFSISAVILAVVLYQTRLVPRWLSIWMGIGGALLMIEGLLVTFAASTPLLDATLFVPIAVAEMVFAVWLIVRGFDMSAVEKAE